MTSEADKLLSGLRATPKTIPCSFLYDTRGSKLYDQIVELPEYYPYNTELTMLHEHVQDILRQIPAGSVVVELGCGAATKTSILLQALLTRDGPDNTFFEGIDVSQAFLDSAKANLVSSCQGLKPANTGTICKPYLAGLQEARDRHPDQVLCVLWLGSSIGNLEPKEALQFFQDILGIGGSQTQVFLCADLWKDAKVLRAAYKDSQGVTEAFIKNGLAHALRALGLSQEAPDVSRWPYHVVVNPELQQVEMWLEAGVTLADIVPGVTIQRGERILMEVSRKFTEEKLHTLAFQSGLFWQGSWSCPLYSMQMLSAPSVAFKACWADGDAFFSGLPDWETMPISVRRPFFFYHGHMASFSKIKLFDKEPHSELDTMFSRGIDPDVDDPDTCHDHPAAPDTWPAKHEIVAYVQQVRERILAAAEAGTLALRAVYMSLEHDRMHLETLEYMKLQQRKQSFEAALAKDAVDVHDAACRLPSAAELDMALKHAPVAFESVPAGTVTLGEDLNPMKGFHWDNEGPVQALQHVDSFRVAAMPVTVQEYLAFVLDPRGYANPAWWRNGDHALFNGKQGSHPASWTIKDGRAWVHDLDGTKGWRDAALQPAWVCLAEARAFCRFKGLRVMTEPEYCRAVDAASMRVHVLHEGGWELLDTPFLAWEGFQAMPDYPEYSADFFDGKHFVMRGSSPATHRSVRRMAFRNWYQSNYAFLTAKFRVCKDADA